jgi:hypothetical protein
LVDNPAHSSGGDTSPFCYIGDCGPQRHLGLNHDTLAAAQLSGNGREECKRLHYTPAERICQDLKWFFKGEQIHYASTGSPWEENLDKEETHNTIKCTHAKTAGVVRTIVAGRSTDKTAQAIKTTAQYTQSPVFPCTFL